MTAPAPHGCTINGQPAMPILISEYHQVTAELAALRAVARGYCPACGRGDAAPSVADWEQQKQRADQAEAAIARVRALHSNENGICGWCKGPDDHNTSWDMEYWPCATYRATLDDPDASAPEFGTSNGGWHWRCNGGQGCDGWIGLDLSSEGAARREYARHFAEEHHNQPAPGAGQAATEATDAAPCRCRCHQEQQPT